MADLVFVVLGSGLFVLSALYVRACARLVGGSQASVDTSDRDRS